MGLSRVARASANAAAISPKSCPSIGPDVPVECPPLRVERLEAHDALVQIVALHLVVVDDGAEVREPVVTGGHAPSQIWPSCSSPSPSMT